MNLLGFPRHVHLALAGVVWSVLSPEVSGIKVQHRRLIFRKSRKAELYQISHQPIKRQHLMIFAIQFAKTFAPNP
jgi:hypothetical protein